MILEKIRIKTIVVIIIPCSPFPDAPRYWEIAMAINRFKIAVNSLVPNVFAIFFNKLLTIDCFGINIQKIFTYAFIAEIIYCIFV